MTYEPVSVSVATCAGNTPADRFRGGKSIGAERTYADDPVSDAALYKALDHSADIVWERIPWHRSRGRTVTLKAKYADFRQITRARSLDRAVSLRDELAAVGYPLLDTVLPVDRGVRLLGVERLFIGKGFRQRVSTLHNHAFCPGAVSRRACGT